MSHKCQGLHRSTRCCRKWFLIDSRSRKLSSDIVMPNLASFSVSVHIARCEKVTSFASITTATPHKILLIFWSWLMVWDHPLHERRPEWNGAKYWSNHLHYGGFHGGGRRAASRRACADSERTGHARPVLIRPSPVTQDQLLNTSNCTRNAITELSRVRKFVFIYLIKALSSRRLKKVFIFSVFLNLFSCAFVITV